MRLAWTFDQERFDAELARESTFILATLPSNACTDAELLEASKGPAGHLVLRRVQLM